MFFNRTTRAGRLVLMTGRFPRTSRTLFAHFCFESFDASCLPCNVQAQSALLKPYVYSALPRIEVPNSSLVLHVRSGDIFWLRNHMSGQPPCTFYLRAIEREHGTAAPFVISQWTRPDQMNPCIAFLEKRGWAFSRRPWKEDLAIMLFSRRYVCARSILCGAVLSLSPWLKVYYIFNSGGRGPRRTGCIGGMEYNAIVWKIGWRDTPEQWNMIFTSGVACASADRG
jgi:hypothetical protein